jgi:hypothetical protein
VNYFYDTNPFDATFTQNGWGRLVAVEYQRVLATTGCGLESGGAKFVEMYSYTAAGLVAKKRLRVTMKTSQPGEPYAEGTADLEVAYTYNGEGRTMSVTYPTLYDHNGTPLPGMTYVQTFDGMGRPVSIRDNADPQVIWADGVQYGPAGELTQISVLSGAYQMYTETRSYNARL